MKKESKRYITSMILHTGHLYANMLALNKILGMPISVAKAIARSNQVKKFNYVHTLKFSLNHLLMILRQN